MLLPLMLKVNAASRPLKAVSALPDAGHRPSHLPEGDARDRGRDPAPLLDHDVDHLVARARRCRRRGSSNASRACRRRRRRLDDRGRASARRHRAPASQTPSAGAAPPPPSRLPRIAARDHHDELPAELGRHELDVRRPALDQNRHQLVRRARRSSPGRNAGGPAPPPSARRSAPRARSGRRGEAETRTR